MRIYNMGPILPKRRRKRGSKKKDKKAPAQVSQPLVSLPQCPDCRSCNFFFDMTTSEWICTNCGSVLTEIEVEFLGLTNHKSKQGVRDYHAEMWK